ncbi:MAG TPA: 2OG-Fe(II) oxygenase [Dyella sp.]|uniref:2OG-Fe(II) oxygenase n=1 Tax=Dyella sp. TaxID=1869338 RepID=UPI002F92BF62
MESTPGLSIVSQATLDAVDEHRQVFVDAQPFRHVVIENFFDEDFAQQLLGAFPSFERGNAVGDDGQLGAKSTLDKVRQLGPAYERLDDAIKSPEFLQAIGKITGIDDLIYDPWYLGGGTHENKNHAALDSHVDFNYHPSERWHRRLNLIVYLNHEWDASWGGCLELFRDPHVDVRPSRSIAPLFNRCVIFETTEHSWHGFDPIRLPEPHADKTRRSVALYFYTKDRPAAETAPRHTTYYVNRQLPEQFAEGHSLTRGDVAELKQLLEVRDAHIRMLYRENTSLRKAQDTGLTGNLLYLAKRAYIRFRR